MKKNIAILALLVMSTTLAFTQGPPLEMKTSAIEKKVMNKIRRNVITSDFMDYVAEGSKESLIVSCYVNSNDVLEFTDIQGQDKELVKEVKETLKACPIKVDSDKKGELYHFKMTFEHRPRK